MCCCQHSGHPVATRQGEAKKKKKHPAAIPIPNRPSTWKKKQRQQGWWPRMIRTSRSDEHPVAPPGAHHAAAAIISGMPREGIYPSHTNPLASRCFSQLKLVVICVPGGFGKRPRHRLSGLAKTGDRSRRRPALAGRSPSTPLRSICFIFFVKLFFLE